jgi:hypothetical protein
VKEQCPGPLDDGGLVTGDCAKSWRMATLGGRLGQHRVTRSAKSHRPVAEAAGFEPARGLEGPYRISSAAPSAKLGDASRSAHRRVDESSSGDRPRLLDVAGALGRWGFHPSSRMCLLRRSLPALDSNQ